MPKHKVLVIKLGYSEVLDMETDSRKMSLGDVLRTTVLLNLYKEDDVTWLCDREAIPLLKDNPYIKRLIPLDYLVPFQIIAEKFDTVINLEKVPAVCALSNNINAWRKYGFRFDENTGLAEAYDRSFDVLAISSNPLLKKENKRTFQDLIFEMVGAKWDEEEYILGYNPKKIGKFDVALNTQIGQRWPTKAWPTKHWDALEDMLLKKGYSVSRQDKQPKEILTDLYFYMDWLNSCDLIVSNDSLGMHIAIALKKNTIGLFGPTPHQEVHFYGRGTAIVPQPVPDCMPCFSHKCTREENCMNQITPEKVYAEVKSYSKQAK